MSLGDEYSAESGQSAGGAALDLAHVGDVHGALGTLTQSDLTAPGVRLNRWRVFLAVLGPGLIVMVGDNDAGAFSTYTQAGQDYGTHLLWTLLLLIPVLYVNQEMVLRLGAVTRVGHARLILERFGRFWGAFSVIDLFLLNALTIVTEFIGISLGMAYLGLPKNWGVAAAALLVMASVSTGDFRRFERFALALVAGSLILIPVVFMAHPPWGVVGHDFFVPRMPQHASLADVMLLIIAIVGTTVAPWQLFFQQSYVIDKRITTRLLQYERADLIIGIGIVIAGAAAMMAFCAAAFTGRPEFGHFEDAGAVAAGLAHYVRPAAGVCFAIALIDASMIGAAAVSLATAYAIGDVLSVRHSLHRGPKSAKAFYGVYFALIALAAALVILPGIPLGLLTNAVQTLAGVLLPSATVFLFLLCNDDVVLGPWVNSRGLNVFTALVVGVLVTLSVILTAAVLFPNVSAEGIERLLAIGSALAILGTIASLLFRNQAQRHGSWSAVEAAAWQMPALAALPPLKLTALNRLWLIVLRGYLVIAVIMVAIRVAELAHQGAAS
jgi:NRAMP (natural resistance-associated macrophage protein)-like metal ion transporter